MVEPRLYNVAVRIAVGRFLVSLFPVAFAVPKCSRLVMGPERVVFRPYAVIERYMFLARGSGARREPLDGGEEASVVGFVELQPLFAGACPGHSGVILGGLISVVLMEDSTEDGHIPLFFHREATQFFGGVVRLIGSEAANVGVPLSREVDVVDGDGIHGATEIIRISCVEFRADGLVAVDNRCNEGVFGFLGEGRERPFNRR